MSAHEEDIPVTSRKLIRKTFKFRLYPTQAQREAIEGHLRLCCELYNAALQERRDAWKTSRVSIGFRQQSAQLSAVKAERPDVAGVYAQVLQDVLRRVDKAFKGFVGRVHRGQRAGFPRFRAVRRFDSLTYPQYPQHGFAVNGRRLMLSRIGSIKIKIHRPIKGTIKTLTVKREAGKWFACFSVIAATVPLPVSSAHIGVDVGLTAFATLSDGTSIRNPRYARLAEVITRKAQRRIARRRRGGTGWREGIRLLQAAQAHVRRQRSDFHHKEARKLVNVYGLISVEDLNVKGLVAGVLAKSVHDAGWSSFINKLAYKAESAGRMLVRVNPRGTSQTCTCGAAVPKTLSQRWHQCPECGLSAARDHVSAQLIDRLGLSRQDPTWATAPCVS
jgi:putative transposase